MSPDNIRLLASIAGIIIGFFGVVTVPITIAIKSNRNEQKADVASLRFEIAAFRAEMKTEFVQVRSEMKDIRSEMKDMEVRLNQRIDTHLVHR